MIAINEARKIMREAFEEDLGFKKSYEANIAMLIYDDQMAGIEIRSHEAPTNLSTIEGCNSMASRILHLIFG